MPDGFYATGGGINSALPELKPGDTLRAELINVMNRTLNEMSQVNRGEGQCTLVNGGGRFSLPDLPDSPVIPVYNTDNVNTIPAYGVTLQNDLLNGTPAAVISVKQPDTYGCQYNAIINGPNAIKAGSTGNAQVGPIFICAYDSADGTPAANELWGPVASLYTLRKHVGGFQIIGVYDSTKHLALVRAAPFIRFRGNTNVSIAPDLTGFVEIFYRSSATEYTDSGFSKTVLNDLDQTIAGGADCECVWDPYGATEAWKLVQADFSC